MKKIIVLISCVLMACEPASKYEIRSDGTLYLTNAYKKVGDCIAFEVNDQCNCQATDGSGDNIVTMTICGNYSIQENKNYVKK